MQVSVEQDFSHTRVNRAYEFADLSDYSFKDRLLIRTADLVFYLLINLIGLTARFEVIGWENHEQIEKNGATVMPAGAVKPAGSSGKPAAAAPDRAA